MRRPSATWRAVSASSSLRPGPRSGAASVVFEDSLYVFGGYGGNGRLDDLWAFSFVENAWKELRTKGPAPAGRENNGAVVYKDSMYIFGGYSGTYWLNDFSRLNFRKQPNRDTLEWSAVLPRTGSTPSTRFGYVSAVWRDSFFIFGGYDGSSWLNDLHEFSFPQETWSLVNTEGPQPSVRSCPSWAPYQHCVYIFGGYDGVHRMNDFHELDLERYQWRLVQFTGPAPSPRYFHSSVVYRDSLYLFGGFSGNDRLQDLHQFSFDTGIWTKLDVETPPSGRSSLVAQVYKSSIFVFGGYNGSNVLNDFYEYQVELVSIPKPTLTADLLSLIDNPLLSDVTFSVEGRKVRANKAILAARSEHFRACLYGGMKEQQEETIVIADMPYDVFVMVLQFLYTDIVPGIASETAVSLLVAAERFMLERLKALCQDYIRTEITFENVTETLITAHHHRAFSLKDICIDFICSNYETVKRTTQFREMIQEPELMMEILLRR